MGRQLTLNCEGLEVSGEYDDEEELCDGCGRDITGIELRLTGIRSCCGGGCVRTICKDCVMDAVDAFNELNGNEQSSSV